MINTSAQVAIPLPANLGTGGINQIWWFDPGDVSFTGGGATLAAYTALAVSTAAAALSPAVTKPLYKVQAIQQTGYHKDPQSQTDGTTSPDYKHEWGFMLPYNVTALNQFRNALDIAAATNGIGLLWQENTGKIFVAGELLVANTPISQTWRLRQDGSDGGSGTKYGDQNGHKITIRGDFWRPALEVTASLSSILALVQ